MERFKPGAGRGGDSNRVDRDVPSMGSPTALQQRDQEFMAPLSCEPEDLLDRRVKVGLLAGCLWVCHFEKAVALHPSYPLASGMMTSSANETGMCMSCCPGALGGRRLV